MFGTANAGQRNRTGADLAITKFEKGGLKNYLQDLLARGLLVVIRLLPYDLSLRFAAWFAARILAPLLGANKRIRANFELVWPDLPEKDVGRLCAMISGNAARMMVESFRPEDFNKRAERSEFTGPGKETLLSALQEKHPVILVSGHFGNFHAIRVLLRKLGHDTAGIYRPMNNTFTNRRYVENMNRIAGPNYPRGISGTKQLLKHLKNNEVIALLNDQGAMEGQQLTFMGKPAWTMTSAAEFSLKYGALLIPVYSIRLPSGGDFKVVVEEPIQPSDPLAMTQELNDSLENMVRRYPEQWFWLHRRWKY